MNLLQRIQVRFAVFKLDCLLLLIEKEVEKYIRLTLMFVGKLKT